MIRKFIAWFLPKSSWHPISDEEVEEFEEYFIEGEKERDKSARETEDLIHSAKTAASNLYKVVEENGLFLLKYQQMLLFLLGEATPETLNKVKERFYNTSPEVKEEKND